MRLSWSYERLLYQLAQNMRDMIGTNLNPTQLEEAHELAKELWEKYGNKSKN